MKLCIRIEIDKFLRVFFFNFIIIKSFSSLVNAYYIVHCNIEPSIVLLLAVVQNLHFTKLEKKLNWQSFKYPLHLNGE